ncbi:hypothetical protein [Burkholderia sp. 22PA0106]|uniref:hypothetical protein n=1 Tax=Burkholderia sp. 22PA0106 TaxID=3237371 RepID=UPI0039C31F1F
MAQTIDETKLHPYAAFLLFEKDRDGSGAIALKDLAQVLAKEMKTDEVALKASNAAKSKGVEAWTLHFEVTYRASWTDDDQLKNIEHHLVTLVFHDGMLGVAVSDAGLRDTARAILATVAGLKPVAASSLENALLRERSLGTLWMRGVHRKSPFKASSKVLYGPQVLTALNPLDDRTFLPSSARADTDATAGDKLSRLGVTPDKAYVWLGPTKSLGDFYTHFKQLIDYIKARNAKSYVALPILTRELSAAPSPGEARDAFDFDFVSAATALDLSDALRSLLDGVEQRLGIRTKGNTTDQNFILYVSDLDHPGTGGSSEWQVNLSIDLANGKVTPTVSGHSKAWPRWQDFRTLLLKRSLWAVWFETGHCFSGGKWTLLDVRASSFEGELVGVDFETDAWRVHEEKPQSGATVLWNDIGTDKTLFSWCILEGMQASFPTFMNSADPNSFAYAICDDGSNELGDFIVLAKDKTFATVTNPSDLAIVLFHVKAASSAKVREMAPKRYEEVLGQATKNLGRIQFPDTKDYLLERLTDGHAMLWEWAGTGFNPILKRGAELAENARVRDVVKVFDGRRAHVHVIVVQPHQDLEEFRKAMDADPADFKTRMLCTLLCAADGAARSSSAKLRIVMSEPSPRPVAAAAKKRRPR